MARYNACTICLGVWIEGLVSAKCLVLSNGGHGKSEMGLMISKITNEEHVDVHLSQGRGILQAGKH